MAKITRERAAQLILEDYGYALSHEWAAPDSMVKYYQGRKSGLETAAYYLGVSLEDIHAQGSAIAEAIARETFSDADRAIIAERHPFVAEALAA